MANDFTRLPIVLTTTMGATYRNSSPPNVLSIYPEIIFWLQPSTAGHTFVIGDPAGNTIFTGYCEANNQSQYFAVAPATRWFDWQLTTLASGTLYIWFKT